MSAPVPMNTPWKVILAFIVVFVAGVASGWVLTLRFGDRLAMQRQLRPQNFGVELMRRWVRSNQLDLTSDQQDKIRPIVTSAAEDLRRLRREDAHTAQLMIERMQDEIAALLTPDQRNKFNEMIEQQREKMGRFMQEQQRRSLLQQGRSGP